MGLAIFLSVCYGGLSFANDESDLIQRYFEATGVEQHFTSLRDRYYERAENGVKWMWQEMYYEANVPCTAGTATELATVKFYKDKLHEKTKRILSWENIEPELTSTHMKS